MKKIITIILLVVFMATLSACSEQNGWVKGENYSYRVTEKTTDDGTEYLVIEIRADKDVLNGYVLTVSGSQGVKYNDFAEGDINKHIIHRRAKVLLSINGDLYVIYEGAQDDK